MENRRPSKSAPYRWLLVLSTGALIWGTVVFLTGGFALELAGYRLSSTHAATPFWIAGVAFAAYLLSGGVRGLRGDLVSLRGHLVRSSPALAGLAAAGGLLVGLGYGHLSSTAGPPEEYEPLPIIGVSPRLLNDDAEIREYVNAFPIDEYDQYHVRGVGRFFVDHTEDIIKKVVADGEVWEKHVVERLKDHIEPGTVVIEVGAHIGSHTVLIARLVGPWGRVYAFEPQRKIYRELHHNLALNGITNARILRYAVGSGEPRIIEMNPATQGNEGGTGVGSGGDRAELRSLDSFGFERVSLIKIDVEHYENMVLDGAVDTIRRNRPVILIEIMGGQDYETASPDVRERIDFTREKIERLGYTVTPVFKHDYIALPNED